MAVGKVVSAFPSVQSVSLQQCLLDEAAENTSTGFHCLGQCSFASGEVSCLDCLLAVSKLSVSLENPSHWELLSGLLSFQKLRRLNLLSIRALPQKGFILKRNDSLETLLIQGVLDIRTAVNILPKAFQSCLGLENLILHMSIYRQLETLSKFLVSHPRLKSISPLYITQRTDISLEFSGLLARLERVVVSLLYDDGFEETFPHWCSLATVIKLELGMGSFAVALRRIAACLASLPPSGTPTNVRLLLTQDGYRYRDLLFNAGSCDPLEPIVVPVLTEFAFVKEIVCEWKRGDEHEWITYQQS